MRLEGKVVVEELWEEVEERNGVDLIKLHFYECVKFSSDNFFKEITLSWWCSSVVEHLPGRHDIL